jgi:hypothetical protein
MTSGNRTNRGHSSIGRAPALQAGGRRFDPVWLHQACHPGRALEKRSACRKFRGCHRLGDDGRVLFLHREEKVCSSAAPSGQRVTHGFADLTACDRTDLEKLVFFVSCRIRSGRRGRGGHRQ